MCLMIIQKQTAGTLAFAPPFFSSAGAKRQRSFNGLVFFLNLHLHLYVLHVCNVARHHGNAACACACRGWSGTGTDRVLQKPLLLAYHCRRVRRKCLSAQVLKSHFWHSSATTSNRQQHHSCIAASLALFASISGWPTSSQEFFSRATGQLRLMKLATSWGCMMYICIYNAFQIFR